VNASSDQVVVTLIYPVVDRQWLMVHLGAFTDAFHSGDRVALRTNRATIRMRVKGVGLFKDLPFLVLECDDPTSTSIKDVLARIGDEIHPADASIALAQ